MGARRWIDHDAKYDYLHSSGYRNDDGQRIGEWVSESEDKLTMSKTQYRNGQQHGIAVIQSGIGLQLVAEFREGLQQGSSTMTYTDGSTTESEWVRGKRHGVEETTNSFGNLVSSTEYAEGKKNGTHVQNHYTDQDDSNFERQEEIQYDDDVPVGTRIVRYDHDSDGEVDGLEKTPYVDGEFNGVSIYESYTSEGYRSEQPYVDGVAHGMRKSTWGSGERRETPFVDGKQHGMEIYSWPGGERVETPYVDGQIHGVQTHYRSDESVSIETPYVNGLIHGTQKWYDKEGELEDTSQYVEGEMLY